jgi:hypothetical protein
MGGTRKGEETNQKACRIFQIIYGERGGEEEF